MSNFRYSFLPMGLFRDADEPVICGNNAVIIQKLYNGCKIMIYDVSTGFMKWVSMKNVLCFNVHADNKCIAFEYAGAGRGIGIIAIDNINLTKLDDMGTDIMLGGVWGDFIAFRRGIDIVLYNTKSKTENVIASCRHISGPPVVGCGCCAWLQRYRDKSCVALYDIETGRSIFLSSSGYINGMHIAGEYLVYQNCSNNECSIYVYDIKNGRLERIFASNEWIDLYRGKDDMIVWTSRKKLSDGFSFDVWGYNIHKRRPFMILSDCRGSVIPAVAEKFALVLKNGSEGDSLMLMPVEM